MSEERSPITELLEAAGQGDDSAHEQLWTLIYDELHRLAQQQMANEPPGRTLQPTALVHEAYLRLLGGKSFPWANRRQFFAAAAKVMRRIRTDDARRRNRLKRGGPQKAAAREEEHAVFDQNPAEVLAVDEALAKLNQVEPRLAEVVLHRYFSGLTVAETAEILGLSVRTVEGDWHFARAWLHRTLSGDNAMGSRRPDAH